jgi:hypothetical protein
MKKTTKIKWLAAVIACAALLIPQESVSALITASENAGLTGTASQDESTGTITLRDRFGYVGQISEQYAYLRFAIDAANDTIGGVAVGDITSVALDLYFTVFTAKDTAAVYALDDLANPGAGFLTETTWSATGANELSGPIAPHGNGDVSASSYATKIGDYATSSLSGTGLFQLTLNLAAFKTLIADSSNNEITLIVTGPKNSNNVIASLENTSGYAVPSLTVIPEPATLGMVASAGALLMLLRRRLTA